MTPVTSWSMVLTILATSLPHVFLILSTILFTIIGDIGDHSVTDVVDTAAFGLLSL